LIRYAGLVLILAGFFVELPKVGNFWRDAFYVSASAVIYVAIPMLGIYLATGAVSRIKQQGWRGVATWPFLSEALVVLVVSVAAVRMDWGGMIGFQCTQAPVSTASPIAKTPTVPASPFPPGTRIGTRQYGESVPPDVSGYCTSVQPVPGATGTVIAHERRFKDEEPRLVIRWDEQPFRDLSVLGVILDRRVVLQPFVSTEPPSYFEPLKR